VRPAEDSRLVLQRRSANIFVRKQEEGGEGEGPEISGGRRLKKTGNPQGLVLLEKLRSELMEKSEGHRGEGRVGRQRLRGGFGGKGVGKEPGCFARGGVSVPGPSE